LADLNVLAHIQVAQKVSHYQVASLTRIKNRH